MTREVKEWWEYTSENFQEESDVTIGFNWGWDGLDDTEILGDINEKAVLELGCGGGQDTIGLTRHGANVTGIDLTRKQLNHAEDLIETYDVPADLVQGDVTQLPFSDDSFDLAYNTYVFQWVDDLGVCFEETHRVLEPRGQFVFSMPHPFFDLADPETHEIVQSYFDTGRQVTVDGREGHPNLVTYRQRVSDIYNALRGAGFDVKRMLEPGSPDPDEHEPGPWGDSPPGLRAMLPTVLIITATAQESY